MPVIDSATGSRKNVSPAETRPFAAPHTPRSAISPTLQPPASPSASAPARYPSAMISTGT